MNIVIVVVSGILYLIFGVVVGFALSSHKDVLLGRRPNTQNKFILFLARPTQSMQGIDKVVFVIAMLLWFPVFICLVAAPIVLASKYAPELEQLIFIMLIPCVLAGKFYGSYKWRTLL
ncbi:hypothetical protein ACJJIE_22985 [Microbulbifer sp. TRSA001]|uniref:hypothetical protein n=1 Tax=unclassified Microbulbifer TaxID=2619833 RepID=UPI00403B0078